MLILVGAADEGDNEPVSIVLWLPEQAWEGWLEPDRASRLDMTQNTSMAEYSSHEGECSGSDDSVLGGAWRQELDVGGAEDDGR